MSLSQPVTHLYIRYCGVALGTMEFPSSTHSKVCCSIHQDLNFIFLSTITTITLNKWSVHLQEKILLLCFSMLSPHKPGQNLWPPSMFQWSEIVLRSNGSLMWNEKRFFLLLWSKSGLGSERKKKHFTTIYLAIETFFILTCNGF